MSFSSLRVRALFAALLLHPNECMQLGRLAECVWVNAPPSAEPNLRNHASALRQLLDRARPGLSDRVQTRRGQSGGSAYRLVVEEGELDSQRFVTLATRGARDLRNGRPRSATVSLTHALSLWRGEAGTDLPDTPPIWQRIEVLRRRRSVAQLDLCEAQISLGDAWAAIDRLHPILVEAPMLERPVELLMRALVVAGERAEAIQQFHTYRLRLHAEMGLEPSRRLTAVFKAILRGSQDAQPPPAPQ